MNLLKPSLEHNKHVFDQLGRRQKQAAAAAAVCVASVALLFPPSWILPTVLVVVICLAAVHLGLEIGRVRVFRSDLRERRELANGLPSAGSTPIQSGVGQFQIEAEQHISEVLASVGLTIRERRVMTGQMLHMPAAEPAVKLRADGVEIWLYADKATYSTATQDRRFETADYPNEHSLLTSLLTTLRTDLHSP